MNAPPARTNKYSDMGAYRDDNVDEAYRKWSKGHKNADYRRV
jgi:hypothetical protein